MAASPQAKQAKPPQPAEVSVVALFRGISPSASLEGRNVERDADEGHAEPAAVGPANSVDDVARTVREKMEHHRARQKRRAIQREE
jgi:hypothetical protein